MVTGTVERVISRPYGNKTMWTLKLVNDEYYGFGASRPRANEGDKVKFEAKQNDRGYWQGDIETLAVKPAEQAEVRSNQPVAAVAPRKTEEEKGFWNRREVREVENDRLRSLGACRNTAIEWLKFLCEKGAIPEVKKTADKEDVYNRLLDDYTAKFLKGIEPSLKEEATPVDNEHVEEETFAEEVSPAQAAPAARGRPRKTNGHAVPQAAAEVHDELPWE